MPTPDPRRAAREEWGGINREHAIATAPVFLRARLQIARLQDVIDYGIGDFKRAAYIQAQIQSSLDHSIEHEWFIAAHKNVTLLTLTLRDWSFAIDRVCAEVERSMAGEAA